MWTRIFPWETPTSWVSSRKSRSVPEELPSTWHLDINPFHSDYRCGWKIKQIEHHRRKDKILETALHFKVDQPLTLGTLLLFLVYHRAFAVLAPSPPSVKFASFSNNPSYSKKNISSLFDTDFRNVRPFLLMGHNSSIPGFCWNWSRNIYIPGPTCLDLAQYSTDLCGQEGESMASECADLCFLCFLGLLNNSSELVHDLGEGKAANQNGTKLDLGASYFKIGPFLSTGVSGGKACFLLSLVVTALHWCFRRASLSQSNVSPLIIFLYALWKSSLGLANHLGDCGFRVSDGCQFLKCTSPYYFPITWPLTFLSSA